MFNEEYAIQIENLSKKYTLYDNPRDRIMDLLGLGKFLPKQHSEFIALNNVNLNIKKGSKLALVGRNGAGKSTLLKIISGNLKSTTGSVKIHGKVSALMELGTGFHPEFTGRDNIFASLSYSGIVGREAKEIFDEIVDFSELEDFIDKPVKTYSAGMYARLAFATSTAVVPEILIIDEILGAGDAYFVNKSIDRMKKLTEGGTTVLFVSHDISAVQKMCTEAIWIDKGKVIMEGHILDVTAEYLASIRKQEELRLKARNIRLKHNNFKSLEVGEVGEIVYFHLITESGPPKGKHPIAEIKLLKNNKVTDSLNLGESGDTSTDDNIFLIVDNKTINWSEPKQENEVSYRNFENVGGEYLHALFAIRLADINELKNYKLEIKYQDASNEKVKLEYYNGEEYIYLGELAAQNDNSWKVLAVEFPSSQVDEIENIETLPNIELEEHRTNNSRIYGSGEVIITSVQFLDEHNEERLVFTSQNYKKLRIHYHAKEKVHNPVFVAAYYMLDGTCATQLISNKDDFAVKQVYGNGYVDIIFDPLYLGKGNYLVSIAIFKGLNLLDNIEPEAYDLHDKMYEIKIEQPFGINVELGIVNQPVRWGITHG